MDKLIKFELHKLFRKKILYIFFAVAAGIILIEYFVSASAFLIVAREYPDRIGVISPLEDTFSSTSNSSYYLLLPLLITIFICEDYSTGAIKNVCTKGYTRLQIVFAKFISSLVAAFSLLVVAYIANILFSICSIAVVCSQASNISMDLKISQELINTMGYRIVIQILVVLAYTSFFYMLSMFFGKLGAAIPLSILGVSLINLVLMLITVILKLKDIRLTDYWLSTIGNTVSSIEVPSDKLLIYSILLVAYSALFVFLAWVATRRKEVK